MVILSRQFLWMSPGTFYLQGSGWLLSIVPQSLDEHNSAPASI